MTGHRPTQFSTALVVIVTLSTTAAFVASVGLVRQTLYGAGGALVLATLLWLLASDRWRPLGSALAAPVFPVISLSLLAGAGYTVAAQLRGDLPVGSVFLVVGATIAAFGAALAVRDVLAREPLARCLGVGMRATVVVGSAMALAVALRLAPLGRRVADAAQTGLTSLFAPASAIPLASFLALLLGVFYLGGAAVRALPLAELLGGRIDDRTRQRLEALDRYLGLAAILLVFVLFASLLLELSDGAPYAWLPAGVRGLVGPATRASTPRVVLGVLVAVSLAILLVTKSIKRSYRSDNWTALAALVPYASGAVLAAAVLRYHEPLVATLIERIARRLPAPLVGPFEALATEAVSIYGEAVMALVVVTTLLLVTLSVALVLFLGVLLGLLSERAGGASLAAGGLFTTAAFAAVLGAGIELAAVGVVASLLVWDVGEFGVTLGEKLGTAAATVRPELVHAGGTVLVGTGTVALVLLTDRVTAGVDLSGVPVVPALLGAVAGTLLLVVASR